MKNFSALPKGFKISFVVGLLLVIGLSVTTTMLYRELNALKHPEASQEKELAKIIAEIGKTVYLPTDELPTLATVSDPEKLKDQPFFARAEVGDKVLVYPSSRKAILWRPSTKKIIEISGINISDSAVPGN